MRIMDTDNNVKFALALMELVNKKKEEIKTLTSEIIELENDPKNIVKIKQDVQSILNAVASCSNSNSNDLEIVEGRADLVFYVMRMLTESDGTISSSSWHGRLISHQLEDFCTRANAWNPIKFDFTKKGLKVVLPKIKNLNLGIITNK